MGIRIDSCINLIRQTGRCMDEDAGKRSQMAGGLFMGPFIMIVFMAFYFGFFDLDFGLKGNILGSMGTTFGVTICVTAILYKMGQINDDNSS